MKITKYKHATFTVESQGKLLFVDMGSYISPEEITALPKPAACLVSHIHADHFNLANLEQIGVPVYTVAQVGQEMLNSSLEVTIKKAGETVLIPNAPFEVTFIESDHGPHVPQPLENVGFLISDGTSSLWFLGDMYNPLTTPPTTQNAILIPVGNHNYTMGPQEAADYVEEIGWKGVTIPVHYDSPSMDPQSGIKLKEIVGNKADIRVLAIGESLEI